ncbi:hypothetical protein MBAV_005944 [Candidatus Magnetobacterium bavaricum]|uniref:Uncharacterized protein n=1 Tax=Candidatus Magnetobacterium bavaricum TaxID=29290 RepID=A0A0F3GIT1_9BACT|nr:hypothetical protein MBAV_005944 [Candidatus Magnetobacterium bavaricum]
MRRTKEKQSLLVVDLTYPGIAQLNDSSHRHDIVDQFNSASTMYELVNVMKGVINEDIPYTPIGIEYALGIFFKTMDGVIPEALSYDLCDNLSFITEAIWTGMAKGQDLEKSYKHAKELISEYWIAVKSGDIENANGMLQKANSIVKGNTEEMQKGHVRLLSPEQIYKNMANRALHGEGWNKKDGTMETDQELFAIISPLCCTDNFAHTLVEFYRYAQKQGCKESPLEFVMPMIDLLHEAAGTKAILDDYKRDNGYLKGQTC